MELVKKVLRSSGFEDVVRWKVRGIPEKARVPGASETSRNNLKNLSSRTPGSCQDPFVKEAFLVLFRKLGDEVCQNELGMVILTATLHLAAHHSRCILSSRSSLYLSSNCSDPKMIQTCTSPHLSSR